MSSSLSPRRPKSSGVPGQQAGQRLEDVERQLSHALSNFAVVEDKLRTEQELGKAFYLLKQEKADLLRTKLRHNAEGTLRTKLEEKIHAQEVELQTTQQQLLAMRQRVVSVEAERDFIRAQAGDFSTYWQQIEAAWRKKESDFVVDQRAKEVELAQLQLQLLDARESQQAAICSERSVTEEACRLRDQLQASQAMCRTRDEEISALRQTEGALQRELRVRDERIGSLERSIDELMHRVETSTASCSEYRLTSSELERRLEDTKQQLENKDRSLQVETGKNVAAMREISCVRRELEAKHEEVSSLVLELECREDAARASRSTEESLRRSIAGLNDEIASQSLSLAERKRQIDAQEDKLRGREKEIESFKTATVALEAKRDELTCELERCQHRTSQLVNDKEVLNRELLLSRKEAKAAEDEYARATQVADQLQAQLSQTQQNLATARSEAGFAKTKTDKSIDALERDVRSLSGEVSRRNEDVRLLEERLRAAHEARGAAEAVASRHEESVSSLRRQLEDTEQQHKLEVARLLDKMQLQCVAMDRIAADLPTVEDSRRRIAEVRRYMATHHQTSSAAKTVVSAAADGYPTSWASSSSPLLRSPQRQRGGRGTAADEHKGGGDKASRSTSSLAPARPLSAALSGTSRPYSVVMHDDRKQRV